MRIIGGFAQWMVGTRAARSEIRAERRRQRRRQARIDRVLHAAR